MKCVLLYILYVFFFSEMCSSESLPNLKWAIQGCLFIDRKYIWAYIRPYWAYIRSNSQRIYAKTERIYACPVSSQLHDLRKTNWLTHQPKTSVYTLKLSVYTLKMGVYTLKMGVYTLNLGVYTLICSVIDLVYFCFWPDEFYVFFWNTVMPKYDWVFLGFWNVPESSGMF